MLGVTMAFLRGDKVACPFFTRLKIVNDGLVPHSFAVAAGRGMDGEMLRLGTGNSGIRNALREFCNRGYANACPHLPLRRDWMAVRFSVARAGREQVTICLSVS